MDHGRIKEIGTHAELLEKSGYYRRLYDMQFKGHQEEEAPVLSGRSGQLDFCGAELRAHCCEKSCS